MSGNKDLLDDGDGYDSDIDIPERLTNRFIIRDRLLDRLMNKMGTELRTADDNDDNAITFQELEDHMRDMNKGNKYDTVKIRKFFKELKGEGRDSVPIDEFCYEYSEKVEDYTLKILECKRKIMELRNEVQLLNTQKQETAKAEKINQFGIMEGSVLIVTICEARNLLDTELIGNIDPFVLLICEGQKIETSYKPDTNNPIWNECFTFDIKRGDDPLRLTVYDRGTFANSFIGKVMINLDTLGTQQEIRGWYNLHEENYDSGLAQGQLKIKIQWIYSRLSLLSEKVFQLQENIKQITLIKRAHERERNMIQSPFVSLFRDKGMIMEDDDMEFMFSIYQVHPKEFRVSKQIDKILEPTIKDSVFGENFWVILYAIAYIVYFIITMLVSLYRPDFLNQSILAMGAYILPCSQLLSIMNSPRDK